MKTYTRDNMGDGARHEFWPKYRKATLTPAIYVGGPFKVKTREGTLECEDGYLAVDAHGWPYPIAKDEFDRIYDEAVDGDGNEVR